MSLIKNDNSALLFINDSRATKSHPSMKGRAQVEGKQYWVAAWTKVDEKGNKYLSIAFEPMEGAA